ncbi:MAG: hypothetical protein HXY34_03520 [Candidatus Thorarchaeota archaeon]|nr:hypothetical protein [Candidatus Thorarchaeota archaeon]
MSTPKEKIRISIYGRNKEAVDPDIGAYLCSGESPDVYSTWVNVSVMRRLGFLFVGGVESAGGLFDIVFVFVIMAIVLAAFVFWQLVVFFIVMMVLGVLSGGAAFKYLRGTFIEMDPTKVRTEYLEDFVRKQVSEKAFVRVGTTGSKPELPPLVRAANRVTTVFQRGIQLSLLVATVFLVIEVYYWLTQAALLTDTTFLLLVGSLFILSVLVMDAGVLMSRRLRGRLNTK